MEELKKPAGILIKDSEINKEIIIKHLNDLIISVGDATTDKLISLGIVPDIQIVDGKERRVIREAAGKYYNTELRCNNPAGSITCDAINALKVAISSNKPVRILVDGEEDLFGLIALAFAPYNSTILYGQPLEGMVILKVDSNNKDKFKNLISKIIGE